MQRKALMALNSLGKIFRGSAFTVCWRKSHLLEIKTVSFHFALIITGARTFLSEGGMGACPSMSSYTVNYGSGQLQTDFSFNNKKNDYGIKLII